MSNNQQNVRIPERPKAKVGIHVLWAFLSGGIGNIIYYLMVKNAQKEWDQRYAAEWDRQYGKFSQR
jgi:hypothetical protein